MVDDIVNRIKDVKDAGYSLADLDEKQAGLLLNALADSLRKNSARILEENVKDLALMNHNDPNYDRLLLTDKRIEGIANDVLGVAVLPSPVGKLIEERHRPNGLLIQKMSVPLGVVAVIYESRPNVTIDVFTLCFKTGNACILKGGKEAHHSNQILVEIIKNVLHVFGFSDNLVYLLPPEREALGILLNATGLVDVCIPRGGQSLINFVRDNAKIPVIETGAGIVHAYFDMSGDVQKGRHIIDNAKTRRVSVCNALDCLLIHAGRLNDLWNLIQPLAEKQVEILADEASYNVLAAFYPQKILHKASVDDFGREFLSSKMAIKTVTSLEQALCHIRQHSSGHSEVIIAEEDTVVEGFLSHVDAAAVYVNASTAFTDGGQFGMGAEIGISTQKLHARGPMALEALTSYKWIIRGDGQIRI